MPAQTRQKRKGEKGEDHWQEENKVVPIRVMKRLIKLSQKFITFSIKLGWSVKVLKQRLIYQQAILNWLLELQKQVKIPRPIVVQNTEDVCLMQILSSSSDSGKKIGQPITCVFKTRINMWIPQITGSPFQLQEIVAFQLKPWMRSNFLAEQILQAPKLLVIRQRMILDNAQSEKLKMRKFFDTLLDGQNFYRHCQIIEQNQSYHASPFIQICCEWNQVTYTVLYKMVPGTCKVTDYEAFILQAVAVGHKIA